MQKIVVRNGNVFEYTIKRVPYSRSVKLAVNHNGTVEVIAPEKVTEQTIETFVMTKALWVLRSIKRQVKNPRVILHEKEQDNWQIYKHRAHMLVSERLAYFNQYYGFSWNTIIIKKTKSRWGSCSLQGNLNFNYKIALLPLELADYIIVHELCHLKEMNHSIDFWNLVEQKIPDYRELRKSLKLFM
jgi:predicted metal-dependent hydrolase